MVNGFSTTVNEKQLKFKKFLTVHYQKCSEIYKIKYKIVKLYNIYDTFQ